MVVVAVRLEVLAERERAAVHDEVAAAPTLPCAGEMRSECNVFRVDRSAVERVGERRTDVLVVPRDVDVVHDQASAVLHEGIRRVEATARRMHDAVWRSRATLGERDLGRALSLVRVVADLLPFDCCRDVERRVVHHLAVERIGRGVAGSEARECGPRADASAAEDGERRGVRSPRHLCVHHELAPLPHEEPARP